MNRRFIFVGLGLFLAVLLSPIGNIGAIAAPTTGAKLNVVFILADDLGWTDLGCFGSDLYETPSIDRLARDGMKFTQNYSACTVCSPSRASILTGKYPARLHITDWIPGLMPSNPKLLVPDWTKYLPLEETTMADVFRSGGYATACIGKWHLGGEAYYPDKHGFDLNIAGTDAAATKSYFAPWNIPTLQPDGKKGDYLTDRIGDEAVKFIEGHKDKPFFLYLAHFAVHTPIQGKPKLVAKYKEKITPGMKQQNPAYAAMDESMDATVGRVRKTLSDLGLADHTLVVFTSDNGGRIGPGPVIATTSNLPLRAGKGSAYEGGVRVPLIVYWPGITKAASACETPVIGADFYPTLLEIAGITDLPGHHPDGVSIVPLLRQSGELKRDGLFWHYPHHQWYQLGGAMPYGAVRVGDYRLVEFYDDMHVELYNVREDIGEQHDLAASMPDKANELRQRLHTWRTDVGAQMPIPNPKYDPSKPEYDATPPEKEKKAQLLNSLNDA